LKANIARRRLTAIDFYRDAANGDFFWPRFALLDVARRIIINAPSVALLLQFVNVINGLAAEKGENSLIL
jgi:hypothetical protein